ncbi:hypothetical protein HNQ51_002081 [Inhella inkyongensis]|uniref:DUF2241 domain-containing protein n=1 Tax=Inhella inkyongensis TaxID=392593 RepID=A0A840S0Z1_9BURK|nr:ACT domain-containing protein [Inhella inkyongensis]MBB5204767.1 hypothetical protein [Inhella inkyongensis]
MPAALSPLPELLRSLEPELHPGVYVYCVAPAGADLAGLTPIATVAEREGLTLVLPEAQALQAGLQVLFRAAWITLSVHSDLQAIGLTAAFSAALGRASAAMSSPAPSTTTCWSP